MFRSIILLLLLAMTSDTLAQSTPAKQVFESTLPLFDKLWDYSKPAETEIKFREVFSQSEGTADLNYKLELLTQIARTQGLQTKFDDAHKTLDDVEKQLSSLSTDKPIRASVRYELERGRAFNSSKRKEQAGKHFERALEMANQLGEENLAVDAAHMLGIATTGDASLLWNERAVAMAEAASDPKAKGWLGALYNNIGWTYHDMEKYDVALKYFEKDLKWYEDRSLVNQARIARWSIAKMHRLLGDPATAFEEQKTLQAEMGAAAVDDDGYVFEELGECSIALERDESVWKPYIQRAYDILSKDAWSVSQEPNKHARLKELLGIE